MNTLYYLIINIGIWILGIVSFFYGFNLGKGVENKPKETVIEKIERKKEEKEENRRMSEERRIFDANIANIENYTGSSIGQKEIE